jgi:tRNA-splicing ligase RtcB
MPKGKCDWVFDSPTVYPVIHKEWENALTQLGTLGSGNHFIEIQKDASDYVWVMIHSGSRNLGYKVAEYYNNLAYNLNKRWHSNTYLPSNPKDSLAFLPIESQEAKNYMNEMQYCIDFALANRIHMMISVCDVISTVMKIENGKLANHEFISEFKKPFINIAHNYAAWENHFGKNVIVHRKGATLAREGTIGIIPGSQGSKSYIVRGLGNKDSFESCSHGAGRKMGRNVACKTLDLATEQKKLDDQGIIHGLRNIKNLDEATGAYKDIDDVMANQRDLVEIIVELTPLGVIKGD